MTTFYVIVLVCSLKSCPVPPAYPEVMNLAFDSREDCQKVADAVMADGPFPGVKLRCDVVPSAKDGI